MTYQLQDKFFEAQLKNFLIFAGNRNIKCVFIFNEENKCNIVSNNADYLDYVDNSIEKLRRYAIQPPQKPSLLSKITQFFKGEK